MKRISFTLVLIIVAGWAVIVPKSYPCTAICLKDAAGWVAGFNHDWMLKDALIMTNKRGVSKIAAPTDEKSPKGPLARWTSKYGSVTFNQYGREFPSDGMNEKGLFVAILLLENSKWPASDSRASIRVSQWVQYQLDNSSNVQEVIDNDKLIGIVGSSPGEPFNASAYHFFTCDRNGDCVTVEGINGKIVYHSKMNMPVKALSNTPYADSLNALNRGKPIYGNAYHSETRFILASQRLKEADANAPKSATNYAFETLKKVASDDALGPSVWSVIYDLTNLRVSFRTHDNLQVRWYYLSAFDFSCSSPARVFDILSEHTRDVSGHFVPYSRQANKALIKKMWAHTPGLAGFTEEALERAAAYPDSCVCLE